MKKYMFAVATLILLIIDVRIAAVAYPEFITFKSEAPQTVDLVINHVIGPYMMIDVISDLIGFALAVFTATLFIKDLRANNNISPSQCEKYVSAWKRTIGWSIGGFLVYILEKIMPFMANGNIRFRSEYGLYFLLTLCECMTVVYFVTNICRQLENVDNHTYNNVSTILAMLGCLCYTIARILYFYDLIKLFIIYFAAGIIFLVIAAVRLKKFK